MPPLPSSSGSIRGSAGTEFVSVFVSKCIAARDARVRPEHDEIGQNRCVIVFAVRYHTEKYFACGFNVTIALVDCSGWSWCSSDSETPTRSAPSSRRIAA